MHLMKTILKALLTIAAFIAVVHVGAIELQSHRTADEAYLARHCAPYADGWNIARDACSAYVLDKQTKESQ